MPPKLRPLKKETSITSNPPSYPHENSTEYRAFLRRSLDRSDKELAALQTLNRTLHKLKSVIVKKFGESRLLDIGEGLVFVSKETRELVISTKTGTDKFENDADREEFAALAKDFLLRFELRRKLMNRLARRMMRLSHAMDGRVAKLNPPPVPKYGEVRLLSDTKEYEEKLEAFEKDLQEKEAIRSRIRERIMRNKVQDEPVQDRDDDDDDDDDDDEDSKKDTKKDTKIDNIALLLDKQHQEDLHKLIEYDLEYDKIKTTNMSTHTIKIVPALSEADIRALDKEPEDFDLDKNEYKDDIGATIRMNNTEKTMEWKRWKTELLSRIPDQPTWQDLGLKNRVFHLEERRRSNHDVVDATKDEGPETETAKDESNAQESSEVTDVTMASDGDKNEESTETPLPNTVSSAAIEDDTEDKKNTDSKKTTTYVKRKLFSLDPVPSFYEQDYSRALVIHSDIASSSVKESSRKLISDATAEYNEAFRMSTECQNRKFSLESERKKLHMDFQVKARMFERSRMVAYQEWQNKKKQFENQLLARKQMELQARGRMFTREHSRALQADDNYLVRRALSSVVDRVVIRNAPKEHACGTHFTSLQMSSNDIVASQVATSLAHCVDTVVDRMEKGWISTSIIDEMKNEVFPPFRNLDPAKTIPLNEKGETFDQINSRLTSQLTKISRQLASLEHVRAQKWSKLIQAKHGRGGQMNETNQQPRNKAGKNVSRNMIPQQRPHPQQQQKQQPPEQTPRPQKQQYHPQPKPKEEVLPTETTHVPETAKAPVNVAVESPSMNSSHSSNVNNTVTGSSNNYNNKYSIEAVRARISADGSVRPINTPKMTKDGLYMRPAGRQRKGMDWDAVNGIWVPQGTYWNHHN